MAENSEVTCLDCSRRFSADAPACPWCGRATATLPEATPPGTASSVDAELARVRAELQRQTRGKSPARTVSQLSEDEQRALQAAVTKSGESPLGVHEPIEVRASRPGFIWIKFRDLEVEVPAPSSEVVDDLWKVFGGVILGAVITLAGVKLGAKLANSADTGPSEPR
jgi:hypothetical protein